MKCVLFWEDFLAVFILYFSPTFCWHYFGRRALRTIWINSLFTVKLIIKRSRTISLTLLRLAVRCSLALHWELYKYEVSYVSVAVFQCKRLKRVSKCTSYKTHFSVTTVHRLEFFATVHGVISHKIVLFEHNYFSSHTAHWIHRDLCS